MKLDTIQQVLELSEEILLLARQGDWQKVGEFQALQDEAIRLILSNGEQMADNDQADVIKIKLLLDQVIALSETEMQSINCQMTELKKGRAATQAYEQRVP